MEHEGHQGEKRDILLSGTPFGKEELLVGKQLHERIAEMYRSGRKKKEVPDFSMWTSRRCERSRGESPGSRMNGAWYPWESWIPGRSG